MLVPSDNKAVDLTDKQKDFLDALFGEANGDPKLAGEIAGYSHYTVPLKALKEEIIDVANKILATSAPKASQKLVDILDSDDPIPQVSAKLQAAQTLLDRVGIAKRDKLDVTHTAIGGIFLLPEKKTLIDVNAEDVDNDEQT